MSIGSVIYFTQHPDELQNLVEEVKQRWKEVCGQIKVKMDETNAVIVQEVDKCGTVMREFAVDLEKRKEKLFGDKNEESEKLLDKNEESEKLLHKNEEKKESVWNSLSESFAIGYDSEMSSTWTPSAPSVDCRMTQRNHGPEKATAQTTSFQKHPYAASSSDDDLYEKPLARTIIENLPLEVLEKEISRRHAISSKSKSDDYAGQGFGEASSNELPPALPPRLPIEDGYTPRFSVYSEGLDNADKLFYGGKNVYPPSVHSTMSSLISGSEGGASSWQHVWKHEEDRGEGSTTDGVSTPCLSSAGGD